MTEKELNVVLEKHRKWLNSEDGGEKAFLINVDLRYADLRDANLTGANLAGAYLGDVNLAYANLTGAYLAYANLGDANLGGANLTGAYLAYTNLTGANLTSAYLTGAYLGGAYLTGANLTSAYLTGANLTGANLTGAYLAYASLVGANLTGAYLTGADLRSVIANEDTAGFHMVCPEEGSFIAFKSAIYEQGKVIVKLEIPADAKRSSATTGKCRASKAIVFSITDMEGNEVQEAWSKHCTNFVYRVGETVEPDFFDDDRWKECSGGIHFFMTRAEAESY